MCPLAPVKTHIHRYPSVNSAVFVDDLSFDPVAETALQVAEHIMPAAQDFLFDLEEVVGLQVAKGKAGVVSNCMVFRARNVPGIWPFLLCLTVVPKSLRPLVLS